MRDRSVYEASGRRSAGEIEREIDRVRDDIGDTLQSIRDEVSVGALLDQAMSYARRGPGEMATNLGRAVRDNPIPVLLTGIGVTSLLVASRQPSGAHVSTLGTPESDSRERARHAFGEARDRAEDAAHELSARVTRASRGGREGASRMVNRLQTTFADNPLLLAAVGVAAGAVIASLAPATRRERELFGRAGEEARLRAAEAGEEAARRARGTIRDAGEKAREESPKEPPH